MACAGIGNTLTPYGLPLYSVENDRIDHLTDRAVGDDVYILERGDQCRFYLLYAGDIFNADIRSMGMRLGLSYSGFARPLCMAPQEGGSYA